MIAQLQRTGSSGPALAVRLAYLVSLSVLAASAYADDIATKVDEINHVLLESKIEAVEKALASVREVAADLVKNGDPRKEQMLAREEELGAELRVLQEQRKTNADPRELRQFVKEFEAIEDRGGWWWLDEKKPEHKGWYRLDRKQKRMINWDNDVSGKPVKIDRYSATYEVMGVDPNDENILRIRLIYPDQGATPGDQDVVRFNHKTGIIQTTYGWYGKPKR